MGEEKSGRSAGGNARAKKLSMEKRREIAKTAATARWRNIPKASYSGAIHIGDLELPCCVLEDGTRLLTQYGFLQAIGRSPRPAAGRGSVVEQTAPFLALDNLKPFVSKDLEHSTRPIVFQTEKGVRAFGYKAELLPQVCDVYLAARAANELLPSQQKFAQACEVMMRGLAHVGIVALVDEATGFQNERAKNALAQILENFIAKELQPWVQTFPTEYYQELFRLRGLSFPTASVKRPQYFGVLTNDIVYKRLAPGVLEELKRVTPRNDDRRPKAKYFQSLTGNIGYPKLREHLGKVVMMMQLSTTYQDFKEKLEKFLPKYTDQLPLALEPTGIEAEDDGRGL
jgi:hypothetical protein